MTHEDMKCEENFKILYVSNIIKSFTYVQILYGIVFMKRVSLRNFLLVFLSLLSSCIFLTFLVD